MIEFLEIFAFDVDFLNIGRHACSMLECFGKFRERNSPQIRRLGTRPRKEVSGPITAGCVVSNDGAVLTFAMQLLAYPVFAALLILVWATMLQFWPFFMSLHIGQSSAVLCVV